MRFLLDAIYGLALLLLTPWLVVRSLRTGRYRQNLRAKLFGLSESPVATDRPVVWFHGVSVGEVHLLRQLVAAFRRRYPEWQVVVSTTTDTGLAEARKHFADLPVVAYPFDFSWACRRTIGAIRPRLIVLAESELWPNFLRAAQRANVPVAVVNGRMSPRTYGRYSKVAGLARRLLFDRVALFAMQSEPYAANLRKLGVPPERVVVTGSVKYDGAMVDKDNPKTAALREAFSIGEGDLVWVAGSTHDPEERIVLDAFGRLRKNVRALRLILVPRAPERFDEVARLIEAVGFPYARRSQSTAPTTAPVILVDTLGELGACWGLATIGFTGGSLNDKRGGQSMIEPAGFGVPVLFGPHTWNFRDAVVGLKAYGAAIEVQDVAGLEIQAWGLLLNDIQRAEMGAAARRFVQEQQGATGRTLDAMAALLGPALLGR